jgi:GNAT superfamily N-acetyltransferase
MAVTLVDIDPADERLLADVLPVLRELRPHLTAEVLRSVYDEGVGQGLRFLAAYRSGACVGVAGWRLMATTSSGRKLYVDDLVTTSSARSTGVGAAMLAELAARARAAGCTQLELDSGVQRTDAHRFYFREHLSITAYHFARPLG